MIYLTAFIAMFLFVGLKGFQNLNAVHEKWFFFLPTGWVIGFCEVYVVGTIAIRSVDTGAFPWLLAITIGTAGGLGMMCSTYIHGRARGRQNES